jgi:hypothetical protein
MKTSTLASIVGIVVVASAGCFLLSHCSTSGLDPTNTGSVPNVVPRREVPFVPIESRGQREFIPTPREDSRPNTTPEPDFLVRGVVITSQDERVSGLTIAMVWNRHSDRPEVDLTKEERLVQAKTDENGAFVLNLVRDRWNVGQVYRLRVLDAANRVRFDGDYVLVHDGIILLDKSVVLRGQVEADWLGEAVVGAYRVSHIENASPRFVAREELDEDGRFNIRVESSDTSPAMLIGVSSRNASYQRAFPIADLIRGRGVLYPLAGSPLSVRVADEAGKPVSDCKLMIASADSAQDASSFSCTTDEAGEAVLIQNPNQKQELTAFSEGFAFHHRGVPKHVDSKEFSIRLRRLTVSDRIRGFVFDDQGDIVAGAIVSATYMTDRDSLLRVITTKSDEGGSYELLAGGNAPIRLMAYDKALGPSTTVTIKWGGIRQDLRIMATGDMEIGSSAPEHLEARSGSLAYVLTHLDLELSFTGEARSPIRTFDLPVGRYNCAITSADMRLYGESYVTVVRGKNTRSTIRTDEVNLIHGRLRGERIRGGSIRIRHPWWPESVERSWGVTKVDQDGVFRLFAGALNSVLVDVLDAKGTKIAEASLKRGAPNLIIVK